LIEENKRKKKYILLKLILKIGDDCRERLIRLMRSLILRMIVIIERVRILWDKRKI
jgi:hypothetical protein